jgi:hypothetical protein
MRNSGTHDTDQPAVRRDPDEWTTGDEPMTDARTLKHCAERPATNSMRRFRKQTLRSGSTSSASGRRGSQANDQEYDMAKRSAAKRELINTGTDKRYVRRNESGRFKESDELAQDRQRKAKTKAKRGQGDRGDREPQKGIPRKAYARYAREA